ncbi:MAG: phage portal protein [Eubacterium sp.]|nr:phage portal protein [Eubacterium sp.]
MLKNNEILEFIKKDKVSTRKQKCKEGVRYYEAEHDIKNYRMFYYNADGNLVEDDTRSNIKISHPFFTEIVDQQTQYMLSGRDGFVKSDIQELQSHLEEYFDDDFIAELNDVLNGAIIKGFDYMHLYFAENGKLSFEHIDAMNVVEVKAKEASDGRNYIIYWYLETTSEDEKIMRVMVLDEEYTYFYISKDSSKLVLDKTEQTNPKPHILYTENGKLMGESLGYIPVFRLDNNHKRISNLKPIKQLIDDYDIMSCGLSNNLADFDHPLYVIRGFEGDNLSELSQNLKTKKMIGVDDSGGVEVHTVDIPYEARLAKMQQDEKNIYRFGMGFNSAQLGDGNITNIVIKSRYALLDLKCNKLEIKLRAFLKKLVNIVIDEINSKNKTAYQSKDVYFEFNREVMTNASDNAQIEKTDAERKQIEVNTMLSLNSVIDDKTIVKNICDVLDINYEQIKDDLLGGDMIE